MNQDFIIISEEEADQRLDKVLAKRFQSIKSRTYFQSLLEAGQVLVEGKPVKKRYLPKVGEEVQVNFILTPELDVEPENIPLDIIFEDEHLIVVNKPAGMVVHPAVGNWTGTFVNALLFHCQNLEKTFHSTLRPGIVHRLDKDTTGLLLAAKTEIAHQKLVQQFASRMIQKQYLAICVGNPGEVKIEKNIGRHPVHRKLMSVHKDKGKQAITLCKTLAFDGKISLVQIELLTGRTHQIRVHLKDHGTPILGDSIYGSDSANKKYGAQRQLLHAQSLRFKHPITDQDLSLEAPLPADMAQWIKKLI